MQQQLISLSPDLIKLRDEGYEVEIKGGYVCVHHIPSVNELKEVKFGILISELSLTSPTSTSRPANHAIYFMGEQPCHKDGMIMHEVINSSPNQNLGEGLMGNHYLSSKPAVGYYLNYYDKFKRYISLLSTPAKSLDPEVSPATYKPFVDHTSDSVFNYYDTNSSRANIVSINGRLKGQKIGIIGMGGTGSYILDLVTKTPVAEIHLYDADNFLQHNSFRSPGAPSIEQLNEKKKKAVYFSEIYSRMHKGIIPHLVYITEDTAHLLDDLSFVFICVDKNSVRNSIIKQLVLKNIPFIDVGLGVTVVDDQLIGIVRTTTGTPEKNDHIAKRISTEDTDDNDYVSNIQIADLNSLNAVMAVIKWKKWSKFYQDLVQEHQSSYSINVAQLLNGDTTT
jgi:hypothetical protein